jgi:hypothetical protein
VKLNNVSNSIMWCSYDLYVKTVVIKYVEETNKLEVARKYSLSQGRHNNNKKSEFMPIPCKNCHSNSNTEWDASLVQHQ